VWKKLTGLVRGPGKPPSRPRQRGQGETTVKVETTREVLTAERLDRAFCAELLGVSSFIEGLNPLEIRVMKRVDRLRGNGAALAGLVPRVPAVIPRLVQSLRDDSLSGKQLAAELSRDVALVADVMRYANSAYYRTRESIGSLEQAMFVLGRDSLRSLIARAALKPLMDSRSDYFSALAGPLLWKQAERCTVSSEYIARREGVPVFEAGLAGLVHKVGYKIVARVLSEEYQGGDAPRSIEFRDWLIECVPALSWRVSAQWDLPTGVTEALKGLSDMNGRADVPRLSGVLFVASKLSELYLLDAARRIRGEVKRFSCRINGALTDCCGSCYAEISRFEGTG
jgi:HD-like signal output (HDOD) protein